MEKIKPVNNSIEWIENLVKNFRFNIAKKDVEKGNKKFYNLKIMEEYNKKANEFRKDSLVNNVNYLENFLYKK